MAESTRIAIWLGVGRRNPWIASAADPPFSEKSFTHCAGDGELLDYLAAGNWSVGQAFYRGNLCFIEQAEAGDEWLVARGALPFESVSARWIIRNRGRDAMQELLERYRRATDDQLLTLTY